MTSVFETLIKKVIDEYERDKRREGNPTESDPQWRLYEKSNPVPSTGLFFR